MIHTDLSPELIQTLVSRIRDAEYILIGAGAGLSADAGYDYLESAEFLKRYPYLTPGTDASPGWALSRSGGAGPPTGPAPMLTESQPEPDTLKP